MSFKWKKFNTENWYIVDGNAEKPVADSKATQKIAKQEAATSLGPERQTYTEALQTQKPPELFGRN